MKYEKFSIWTIPYAYQIKIVYFLISIVPLAVLTYLVDIYIFPSLSIEIKRNIVYSFSTLVYSLLFLSVLGYVILHRDSSSVIKALQDHKTLENSVVKRAKELKNAFKKLDKTFISTIQSLTLAIEAKDPYTKGHSERVSIYSLEMAKKMKLSKKEQWNIQVAGILHDIGKIGIDEAILTKPAKLNQEEYEEIREHPLISAKILKPIEFLDEIKPIILHHHEWYDGSGYPDGLSGIDIPLGSRIMAIADTVEATTSNRAYRKRLSVEVVIKELRFFSGTQFDPTLAAIFIDMLRSQGLVFFEKKRRLKDFQFKMFE